MSVERKRCPRCRRTVTRGHDDLGIEVVLDDEVLDPEGELDVITRGGRTYTLHEGARQIAHRSPPRITAHPAGTRSRAEVHPAHRCPDETSNP